MTNERLGAAGRAGWDELVRAVLAQRNTIGPADELVDLGPARIHPKRCGPLSALFVVETGSARLGERFLRGMHLAATGGDGLRWPIVDVIAWEADRLHLEADVGPLLRDQLWAGRGEGIRLHATFSSRFMFDALLTRLAEARDAPGPAAPLINALAASPHDGSSPPPLPAELGIIYGKAERRQATLAGGIAQLVEAGHSVLLLSNDDIAVDRILLAVRALAGKPPPGVFVRVGIPATRAVARDPGLTLQGASAARAPHLVRSLRDLSAQLQTSRGGSSEATEGADLVRARQTLAAADRALATALDAVRAASAAHAQARQALRGMDTSRATFHLLDDLARQVEEAAADTAASASGVGRLAATVNGERRLVVASELAAIRVRRRDSTLAEFDRVLALSRTLPYRRAEVAAADRQLAEVRMMHAAAERAALRAQADRARAATALAELSALVARRQSPAASRSSNVHPELRVRAQLADHRRLAVLGASVVGTTLHELVTNPAVYERIYDHVLIEEAGRMPAAFAIWAATRAGRAVTLAVEPGHSPPTQFPHLELEPPAFAHRWFSASLPQLVRLDRADVVARHISGLVLE